MNKPDRQIAILGAGISGLSTGYALQKKGYRVTIYEKSGKPGGVIQTVDKNGWKLELGPNTLLLNSKKVSDIIDDAGLSEKIVEANPLAKKRFILKKGTLTKVPLSFWEFLSGDLLSFQSKLRLLKEPFVEKGTAEESIASFIRRRLGGEPLNYGVNPFVSGVYAGDPKKLSIKHAFSSLYKMEQEHGSILKGVINRKRTDKNYIKRKLVSFDVGMQALPSKLADLMSDSLKLQTEILAINKNVNGWEVQSTGGTFQHDAVVSTLPAHTLNTIFNTPQTATLLDVNYVPMNVLHIGFKRKDVAHPLDGFGMLIPEVENYNMLGCLFSSTLFENRAPESHVLLTCFMGGARSPALAQKPKEELCNIALEELNKLLGINNDPVFKNHTFWKHAIPQYELGYDSFLDTIKNIESENKGLFLGGNYRGGVSVPDCINNGLEMANTIEEHFES